MIKILNEFDNSVIIKLKERSHSFPGFSNYVTLKFINNIVTRRFAISQLVMLAKETNSYI